MKVPFNKTHYTGLEEKYIRDVLKRGHIAGDGYYTERVSSYLEEEFSLNKVLMTPSATHALEMAVTLLEPSAGDEFIIPSFTFPSTANAVLNRQCRPVFAEIRTETLNIDPADIESRITERTKAIIPVHYGGVGCEMDQIISLAEKYGLYIIEDAAQAVNARYGEQYLGSLGQMGCYSFHGSKNFTCGEGGALVINTDDDKIIKKADIIREKGTDRTDFKRGKIDKYTWKSWGSSYIPSELQMAFLLAQLKARKVITEKRKKAHEFYSEKLAPYLKEDYLQGMTIIPEDCTSNYHIFYLRFNGGKVRDLVLEKLDNRGVKACFHYIPLHLSSQGKKLGYQPGDLPRTEKLATTMLRLPLYNDIGAREMEYVVEKIIEVFEEI